MSDEKSKPKILIVGGGLVGSLNAVFFGQSGNFQVILCEKRTDIRLDKEAVGRSINLALSHRGRSALRAVGLEDEILRSAIPMYARMIHTRNGSLKHIPYGKSDECIFAVDRKVLNELLLTQAENCENVKILFQTKLIDVDFSKRVTKFSKGKEVVEIKYDLLVGNDGAYSTVRQFMAKYMNLNFSQEYIPHGYKEVFFPPDANNSHSMDRNCLHIWPRNEYMLIALPNPGGSFTGTLFMPFDIFQGIESKEDLFKFFEINFPDALEIIGKLNLEKAYFSNETSSMVTIKCNPYHFGDNCVIMGDAAHAMVPFYGQGMNSGFEDLQIFHEILKNNYFRFESTCSQFTEKRNRDAKTICELAFFNYVEMRKNVTSRLFLWRKFFDNFMNSIFPSSWIPLYSMVSFSRIPYGRCLEERQKQDRIMTILGVLVFGCAISGLAIGAKLLMKYEFWK